MPVGDYLLALLFYMGKNYYLIDAIPFKFKFLLDLSGVLFICSLYARDILLDVPDTLAVTTRFPSNYDLFLY